MPEEYSFSEPKVIKISNADIEVVQWLQDSQRVLITEDIRGTSKENIALFSLQTGETNIYAVANNSLRPIWVEKLEAVIYSDWQLISTPTYINGMVDPSTITGRQRLWLTDGNPNKAQILEDVQYNATAVPHEWLTSTFIINNDSSRLVYLKNTGELPWRLFSQMVSQNGLETEKQSEIHGNFGSEGVWIESNKMAWKPYTSQVFFYSNASPTDQTFVLDIDTEQVCSLSFGGWIYFARWSPNGRFLAVVKSVGSMTPIWANYDLNVLDTVTGGLYKIDSDKIGSPNLAHVVDDLSWAPDNHHLAIIGVAYAASNSAPPSINRLYIIDFLTGEVSNPFPTYQLNTGSWGTGLAWSPDGTKILARCPTESEGRLCYIPVQVDKQ